MCSRQNITHSIPAMPIICEAKTYIFGNYDDERRYQEEISADEEMSIISKEILTNKDIQKAENAKIYSKDRSYYFRLTTVDYLGCAKVDCDQKQYLEIFDSAGKPIKKLYLGKIGMGTIVPRQIGYVSYWSDDNKIVLIRYTGKYKVYFVDL